MLRRGAGLVRPGGALVFATCSVFREEGEEVVGAFLAGNPGFRLLSEERRWPHRDPGAGFYLARLERRPPEGANPLDGARGAALESALPSGACSISCPRREGDVAFREFLVGIRDRIVQRSRIGKEKVDAAFARRELDRRLQDLGERYYTLARQGVAGVPDDLRNLLAEVDALATQLQALREQVRRLEEETA